MKPEIERLLHVLNPGLARPECQSQEIDKHLPAKYIDRLFLKTQAARWSEPNKIHLVVGPRQSGKSTAIWKYLSKNQKRPLFLSCEEPLIQEWCTSPAIFLDDIKELLVQIDILFFEEAQHLTDAGLFFKGLVDLKIDLPVIVTGSSSYHLHAKTRESLAGRATRTTVTPLTLEELVPPYGKPSIPSWRQLTREVIDKQLRFGSYPEVWLANDKEEKLFDLIEAFIIRDASDLFKIKHISAFRQLLKLISWQIGNLVNYSEWSSIVGVDSNTTKHYIEILQESGIIKVVEPFAGGKRSEITSLPNIYFADLGLRNALSRQFLSLDERADRGQVFENWVFAELFKLLPKEVQIRFWRSKSGSEVDLVLLSGEEMTGVEVKCSPLKKGKISRSSRSFIEAYKPKVFFVINQGFEGEGVVGETRVIHLLPESLFKVKEVF